MKVFKTALVLTLVGLVCGVAIGLTNYITEPIIERNAQARAREAYVGFFSDLTAIETEEVEGDTYVYEQVKIMKDEVLIGYVFKAKGTNPRGLIDLAVAVSLTGEVKGVKILASENTVGFWDQYNDPLAEKAGTLGELSGVDVIAGVTQSGNLINTLIGAAKAYGLEIIGGEVVVDPYENIFGANTTAEVDESFTTTDILTKREIVKNSKDVVQGFAYTVTGTVEGIPYHDGPARVTLLVGVDLSGKILGVETLVSEHTESYYEIHLPYFTNLKGADLEDYKSVDTIAGATLSLGLIQDLLDAVKAVENPYVKVFGDFTSKEIDSAFTVTETITAKEIIKDEGDVVIGYAYTATGTATGIPGHDNPERVTLLVGVDTEGVVLGVYTLESNHTPGFYWKHYPYFESLVGVNISTFDSVDTIAGATISLGLIQELLNAVKAVA
ncbi:MAG: FMN-binding protein [Acholeplasmataceae bacterium]|nr:FMN-binding protein [Acholeplasmataceae bacterium]